MFEDSPRASWPKIEIWHGYEDPASEFHTCVKREVVYKISGLLDGRLVGLGWDHHLFGFGLRKLCRLRGFLRVSHWDLLRHKVTVGAHFA